MNEFSERLDAIEDHYADYAPFQHFAAESLWLVSELRKARTWRGLLAFLDDHYPSDVPMVCSPDSPDQGPRITYMARQIALVRELHQDDDFGWCTGCEYAYPCGTVRALDGEVPS